MKYILLVGDGMADRPIEELNGRTVLEAADTRYMDAIVTKGRVGIVATTPPGMIPASDVANLAIMGYDPTKYYNGRGPLEASNMGVELGDTDVAFRCNTVTVNDGVMVDYSAGHISTKESNTLIRAVDEHISSAQIKFYPGISYRHLMVLNAGTKEKVNALCKLKCVAPHDILDKKIAKYLPKGRDGEILNDIMEKAAAVLETQDINKVRVDLEENPAHRRHDPVRSDFRPRVGQVFHKE